MDNLEIIDNFVVLKVSTKLYPLDVIYSAAYVFLDNAYILLDGEPKGRVLVRLRPKKKQNLEDLGLEFFNELINYADYKLRARDTKKIREMIIQRALITNDPDFIDAGLDSDEDNFDPEDIAVPWEEKYGNENNSKQ